MAEDKDPNAPGNAVSTGADSAQPGFKATAEPESKQAWRKEKAKQRKAAAEAADAGT